MRTLSIPFLSLLIPLAGCLFAPGPSEPFLREVRVDVIDTSKPVGPTLEVSLKEGPHLTGEDLVVSVELAGPVRQLKKATVDVALYPSGKQEPVRRAQLSQLHAGKLELVLLTTGLHPGSYRLVLTLKRPDSEAIEKAVSFELSRPGQAGLPAGRQV